jgi:hypothetical protein
LGYEGSRGQSWAEMIWWRSEIPQHALCSDWNIMLLIGKAEGLSKMPIWAFKTADLQWPPHSEPQSIPTFLPKDQNDI